MSLPDDLILSAADEVAIRQHLLLVSLGRRPADLAIEVGRLLAVHANEWLERPEIVVSGDQLAAETLDETGGRVMRADDADDATHEPATPE